MDYMRMMEEAKNAMEKDMPAKASIMVQMAIADRLDRLCEIMSSKKGRQ